MKKEVRRFAGALAALLPALCARAAAEPLVSHGDTWRYHCGTNAPQAQWMTVADASLDDTWGTGRGGFGYADGGGQETNNCLTLLPGMKNSYTTFYVRGQFAFTNDLAGDERLILRMDWDDGFIAWLDGRHLTNRYVTGAPRVFNGKEIRVEVLDAGFRYDGETWRSLSAIARKVSGTSWNGYLFFNLLTRAAKPTATPTETK